ncbi:PREDICTED: proton myo-inositol cotransporter-like isoform X1 [Amphimedon queenslandica]|uniref:Major facilitator superfamily (MFS) profile domain-containing protein n=1 Tax=Amphimedon queenslandica TaxID=400682 RepID=A0AAN0JLW9_AMPQE|nr:PREDICTED: proton myo-inositol cotransporter-like isoform X1 [Amphimedon queenslandica]|eukprot:XP_019857805.1 PREDICTED: proton myo-inositol cotransporter-like isoform X1 [Amphimedon queenslandica]
MVLVSRVGARIGVGTFFLLICTCSILSMIAPVYNAELAPKTLRGRLVSLNQLFITAGIMISFCVSVAVHTVDFGWRIALGLQCVLAVVLIIGMVFLPETPRWLVKKGKSKKADKTLHRLRKDYTEEEIKEELNDIEFTVRNSNNSLRDVFADVFRWRILKRILLGVILQKFQQLTGINVIMYYSTSIFCSIDVSSYATTAIVGVVNFLTTLITLFIVDKVGHKSLLLVGALGMCVSILAAGLLIHIFNVDEEREGGSEEERQVVGYFVAFLIVLFVAFFASTWGPVVWVVTSEIFPLSVRGVAVSVTTSGNWIANFWVAMVTPLLLGSVLKTAGTFYILAGFLFASFLFVLLTLPETKGESLERIDELFLKLWLQRINLFYYLRCCCPWSNACRVRTARREHCSHCWYKE